MIETLKVERNISLNEIQGNTIIQVIDNNCSRAGNGFSSNKEITNGGNPGVGKPRKDNRNYGSKHH